MGGKALLHPDESLAYSKASVPNRLHQLVGRVVEADRALGGGLATGMAQQGRNGKDIAIHWGGQPEGVGVGAARLPGDGRQELISAINRPLLDIQVIQAAIYAAQQAGSKSIELER